MGTIHTTYNLQFVNTVFNSLVWKDVILINQSDQTYVELMFFLVQIQHLENLNEIYLPEIAKAMNGETVLDSITSGTSSAELTSTTVSLFWHDTTIDLPIQDFKNILEEYAVFLRSPPLDGSKV